MQIILLEKIVNLGQLGDVVKVKDGYARNFLIPTGKAKRATPANLKEFDVRRAELERESAALLAAAQARGQQLEGMSVQIRQKAGVDGKLFGSVTPADITEALRKNDFPIERTMVRMPEGPLKTIGDFPVVVALHTDVHVSITVSVLAE